MIVVFICSLCGITNESSDHFFLRCGFASRIWSWLHYVLGCNVDLSGFKTVLPSCCPNWCSQINDVVKSAVTYCFWYIWFCINQFRFNDSHLSLNYATSCISAATKLSGRISRDSMSNSLCEWIKCNSDRVSRGNPRHASCGAIFRGMRGEILGCFSYYIGISSSLYAEIITGILAIEIAFKRN